MAATETFHREYGATFEEVAGRRIVADYGRPERTHRAVRNGAGVVEQPFDVVVVEGEDRVGYVDNVVSNRVPRKEGRGCYAVLCDPQGRITTDMTAFHAGERLLLFLPPGRGVPTVDAWEAFVQDVRFEVATDRFVTFGLHGPDATPTLAHVLAGGPPPDERLTFIRGEVAEAGVTVIRSDAPVGEPGYDIVCMADDAPDVLDALVNLGPAAPPFGRRVWEALTLEAGTPLFETELDGHLPNVAGLRSAVDFEKGCFVGQEVVAKVENVGRPSRRLIGLRPEALPPAGSALLSVDSGTEVGEVTRGVESPVLGGPIAMAYVEYGLDPGTDLSVTVGEEPVNASRLEPPFVEGGERSGRLPAYPD